MRKVLSFVLVLALVLSSFSMAFAAEATPVKAPAPAPASTVLTDIEGLSCEQAVKVLVDLAVINGYGDGTYKPASTVTRAEAAVIVIKALGLEKSVGTQKSVYKDMAGYGWAEGYIAFATNLGILTGYGDGTFKPGNPVSYNELAAMLVRSLGYTQASLPGTWPANYVNKAAGLGIMDTIVSGGNNGVNRGDVAIMTANNLTNNIGTINKDGNFEPTVIAGTGTIANPYVYDCAVQRLGGKEVTDVIDAVDGAVINTMSYLGKYCNYFTNKDGDIIAVKEVKSVTLNGTSEDKVTPGAFSVGDVDYNLPTSAMWDADNNGSNEKAAMNIANAKINAAAPVIAGDTDYVLEARVSGKTIKEIYSVSTWTVNEAAKVVAGDLTSIAKAELLGKDFDTNKDDSINVNSFVLMGVPSLEKIKAGDVVYVYTDGSVIRKVAVGTEVVEGKITKDTGSKWTVNKTAYKFAPQYIGGNKYVADKLDKDVKLYLDAYGHIYKFDTTSGSADKYAVVKDNSGSFGSVKLYLSDDSSKVFDTDVTAAELGKASNGAIIGYSLDKKGVIDAIEGTYKEYSAKLISNKVLETTGPALRLTIDSGVAVFTTTSMGAVASSDLGVTKIADVEKADSKTVYTTFGALTNTDGVVVALLVNEDLSTGSTTSSYAVISAKDKVTNPAGDIAFELTGFIDGKSMKDVYTASQGTNVDVAVAAPAVYEIKYNDDKNISKLTALAKGTTGYAVTAGGFQYASDGYLKLAADTSTTTAAIYAISDKAVVYSVTYDKKQNVDAYNSFNGSIKEASMVWLFNYDTDDNEYDVVIVEK